MKTQYDAIPLIIDIIVKKINPEQIILFGSCARRCITRNSDIDICIVLEHDLLLKERAKLRGELILELLEVTDYEVDMLICGRETWERNVGGTIIQTVRTEGVKLYG